MELEPQVFVGTRIPKFRSLEPRPWSAPQSQPQHSLLEQELILLFGESEVKNNNNKELINLKMGG